MSDGVTAHPAADEGRLPRWALPTVFVVAAVATLPDLFDALVVKRAVLCLVMALAIGPLLVRRLRPACGEWFTSAGARLLVAAFALTLVHGLAHLEEAGTTDRLLVFGLAQIAAVLGLACATADEHGLAADSLGRALRIASLPVALVAWAQALGWERMLTPGPEEIVAFSGNSTLAGGLLALGSFAWLSALSHADARAEARAAHDALMARGLPALGLGLVAGAALLTRARGARYAWLAALLVTSLAVLARRRRKRLSEQERVETGRTAPSARAEQDVPDPSPAGLRVAALAVVVGLALASAVGGVDTLLGRKLEASAPILSGQDLTTNVRLALWESTTSLVADSPWLGVGLGRFRAEFPPYRDPTEAALPGLAGATTEVRHPHDELLLVAAEGGVLAGLALALFLLATLRRAWRRAAFGDGPGVLALALVTYGTALALVQPVWGDPGLLLPCFAAVGYVWAARPEEARAWTPTPAVYGVFAALLLLGLAVLAWPRLDTHMSLRSFYLRAEENGGVIEQESFDHLLRAAEVGPGDIDVQRMVESFGAQFAPMAATTADKVAVIQAVDRARERLEALAPHAP